MSLMQFRKHIKIKELEKLRKTETLQGQPRICEITSSKPSRTASSSPSCGSSAARSMFNMCSIVYSRWSTGCPSWRTVALALNGAIWPRVEFCNARIATRSVPQLVEGGRLIGKLWEKLDRRMDGRTDRLTDKCARTHTHTHKHTYGRVPNKPPV